MDASTACLYWNVTTGSWKADGVLLVAIKATDSGVMVGCATVHLTSFAVGTGFLCAYVIPSIVRYGIIDVFSSCSTALDDQRD